MIYFYKCLIVVLMIIIIISAQCPSIDKFSSSDGAFYAIMTVPFPYNHNNRIEFHVQLSIAAKVSSQQNLKDGLSFLGTKIDIEKQQPLNYKLLWPTNLNSVTRKITQIAINNQKVCSSDPLDANDLKATVTEINLSYTFNINIRTVIITEPKKSPVTSPPVTYSPNRQPNIPYDITTSTTIQPIKQSSKSNHCYMLPRSITLIRGGDSSKIGDYPFLGALVERISLSNYSVLCGVTLITEKLVLTAAHCVLESSVQNHLIMFGISDIDNTDSGEVSRIKHYIIHPDYNNHSSDADLAIFELVEKLKFSDAIHAACLCEFQDCFKNSMYKRGVVAGWGLNEVGVPSRTLKKIETSIVSWEHCLRSNTNFYTITSNRTFCAGDGNGSGPCKGDSGSGFYMQLDGRWIIKGIVSRSLANPDSKLICDLSHYVVYVDVSKHFNWVNSYIDKNRIV